MNRTMIPLRSQTSVRPASLLSYRVRRYAALCLTVPASCLLAVGLATPSAAQVPQNYGKLPLSFAANQGQDDPQVRFSARGQGYSLYLTKSAAVLSLSKTKTKLEGARTESIRMELSGASGGVRVGGEAPLPGTVNYMIGDDPSKWHSNIPTFAKVKYASVYPGIDLIYYGNQRQLEYDFVVAPGADAHAPRLHFTGADKLALNREGDLIVSAQNGKIVFHRPVVYQVKNGKRQPVDGSFRLLAANDLAFTIGAYDRSRQLVIDPVLAYSTYLGGSGATFGDYANGIAVDAQGDAYVTGNTFATNFPVVHAVFPTFHNGKLNCPSEGVYNSEGFLTKFNPGGNSVAFSTYFGGSGGDTATAVALDSIGDAYITGYTCSTNFPHYANAYQTTNHGAATKQPVAYVISFVFSGQLMIYSTYLGGTGGDQGNGIAVDGATSNAFVVGTTGSSNFPVTAQAWESTNPNASLYGNTSAFVTEINPYGTQLLLSTYVGPPAQALSNGSNGNIQGAAIALDSEDNIYITGNANTNAFPGTPGAYEPAISGYPGAFVVKLRSTGSSLAYSTFIDGDLGSVGNGIAVDSSGSAYITGWANDGFPVTPGAAQSVNNGEFNANNENPNAFVSKLDPTGSVLVYSTYLGGQGQVDQNPEDSEGFGDIGNGIAVDSFGHAWVTGYTYSTDFPVTRCAYQTTNRTNNLEFTAFLTEVSPDGTAFDYSTYFGGNGGENGKAIAVDGENSIYFAGYTSSTNFPLLNPYQNKNKEVFGSIAFVTKFAQPRRPILCRILKRPTEGR